MALYKVTKKQSNVQTIKVYSGRINLNNGTIFADSDYCYTDFIPFSNGYQIFNVGEANSSSVGCCWYKEDGTYGGNYWGSTGRYTIVNNGPYASTVKKQRMTFRKIFLNELMLVDEVLNVAYTMNYIGIEE